MNPKFDIHQKVKTREGEGQVVAHDGDGLYWVRLTGWHQASRTILCRESELQSVDIGNPITR